jgi:hypothetical protein
MKKVKSFNEGDSFSVEELFDKLDNYLIGDIKKMLDAEVGYPCLMTMLLGMELLGFLLSGDEDSAFTAFWDKLGSKNKKYKSNKLRHVFRQVIRNGIAHIYLPKAGIYVHYAKPEDHLRCVVNGKEGLFISCKALFIDFEKIYEEIKIKGNKNSEKLYFQELYEKISQGHSFIDKYLKSQDFKLINDGFPLSKKCFYGGEIDPYEEVYDIRAISA